MSCAGSDVLCVMPTGAGKSLCYQLPAAVQGGLTHRRLAADFADGRPGSAAARRGNPGGVAEQLAQRRMQREVMRRTREGFEGLLYVAPERSSPPNFQALIDAARSRNFSRSTKPTASASGATISGRNTRGSARCAQQLGSPPTIALTATATEDVRDDIIHQLGLREPTVVVTGFDRPNLSYESPPDRQGRREGRRCCSICCGRNRAADRLLLDAQGGG